MADRRPGNPPSKRATLVLGVAMVAAAMVDAACWQTASAGDLVAYTFGDRDTPLAVATAALWADLGVIIGYGMVLGGFAAITKRMAISGFGARLGSFLLAAVTVAVSADVVENPVLLVSSGRSNSDWLGTATATSATVRWRALVPALLSVATGLTVVWRLVASARFRHQAQRNPAGQKQESPEWWNRVLTSPEQMPARVTDSIEEERTSQADGFSVPGTQEILKTRMAEGHPLTAICLSGGGFRSACIAMGALQTFSKQAPLSTDARASTAEQPIFPYDKTSDHWFSDDQFVAYTELGRVIGKDAVTAWRATLYTPEPSREPEHDAEPDP